MADYYFPIKVTVDVVDGEISDALYNDWDSEVIIAVGTGGTGQAAINALTGGTSVIFLCGSIFQTNTFWIKTSTSTVYAAIGLIRPYCQYSRTTAKKLNIQNDATLPTVVTFDAELAQAAGENSLDRYVTGAIFMNYDDNVDSWLNAKYFYQNGTNSNMFGPTAYNEYAPALDYEGHQLIYMYDPDDGSQYYVNHGADALVPAKAIYFDWNRRSNNISITNPFLHSVYWTGTTIYVTNQCNSGLTLTSFGISGITDTNSSVSIFRLNSSATIPANTTNKAVTVLHPAANYVHNLKSLYLSVTWNGPTVYTGTVTVTDTNNVFDVLSTDRSFDETLPLTGNTSGGTIYINFSKPTYKLTYSGKPTIQLANNSPYTVTYMYVTLYANIIGQASQTRVLDISGNPTVSPNGSTWATVNNIASIGEVFNNVESIYLLVQGYFQGYSGTRTIGVSCNSPSFSASQQITNANFSVQLSYTLTANATIKTSTQFTIGVS